MRSAAPASRTPADCQRDNKPSMSVMADAKHYREQGTEWQGPRDRGYKGTTRAAIISRTDMRFDLVTIFPAFFAGFFEHGIVRRAQADGLVEIAVHDLRGFTHDRHRTVDDRPFGGGEGMVLKPEPLAK